MTSPQSDANPDRAKASEEAAELLQSDNIVAALKAYQSGTPEREIAAEFVTAHMQFIQDVVSNDVRNNVLRSDIEIIDLTSHVNLLLKQKDEIIFKAMTLHSPSHYKAVQKQLLQAEKEKKEK